MPFKFENLEVWQLSIEYVDLMYQLGDSLLRQEEYNLKSQLIRAATSVSLNTAEGSTGQSDPEQARFLSMAIRSLLETVACLHLIRRRNYLSDASMLDVAYSKAEILAAKLHNFRKALVPENMPSKMKKPYMPAKTNFWPSPFPLRLSPFLVRPLPFALCLRPWSFVISPPLKNVIHRRN